MIDPAFFLSCEFPLHAPSRSGERDRALKAAGFLKKAPSRPGMLALQSLHPERIASASIGAWLAGWCVLIVPPDWTADYAEVLTRHADLKIGDKEDTAHKTLSFATLFAGPLAPLESMAWAEDRAALVLPTSGSTGMAKGVCHSLGNLLRSAGLFASHFKMTQDQRLICLAPPHTMSGMRSLVLPYVSGLEVVHLCDPALSGLQLASSVFESAPDHVLCGPAFVSLLAKAAPFLSRLETRPGCFLVTGAALNEDHRRMVQDTLEIPVVNFYGLTETGGICAAEHPGAPLYHCLPPACERIDMRLRAVEGETVLKEVLVATPNAHLGYLGETLQKQTIIATGDLVEVEEDGRWRMVGRRGRALKARSTGWIHPEAVEAWLKAQAHIADAVAKAHTGSDGAAVLEAWVEHAAHENNASFDPEMLLEAMRRDLAPENVPERIARAHIRRSALGKFVAVEEI